MWPHVETRIKTDKNVSVIYFIKNEFVIVHIIVFFLDLFAIICNINRYNIPVYHI